MINLKGISKRMFINETSNWIIQLIRYIFVGGLAFLLDYGLLYLFTEFANIHYLKSATISFIAGLIVNYTLSTKWIFKKSKIPNTFLEFIVYGIIGVIGLLLNDILIFVFTEMIHVHYMISKLLATTIVMAWNFIGRRSILFKN